MLMTWDLGQRECVVRQSGMVPKINFFFFTWAGRFLFIRFIILAKDKNKEKSPQSCD